MLGLLPDAAVVELASALHARLYAPAEAKERRWKELGMLAVLLEEHLQPATKLPYVERQHYEARRVTGSRDAPPAARLQERYGSWKRACYAAWTLKPDGSWIEAGRPWPSYILGKPRNDPYTVEECVETVRACAEALGRIPSSYDFFRWRQNRVARGRRRGAPVRLARYDVILKLLAPHRGKRDGWQIVLETVFPRAR
jgi:hypothetical protein